MATSSLVMPRLVVLWLGLSGLDLGSDCGGVHRLSSREMCVGLVSGRISFFVRVVGIPHHVTT